MCQCLALFLMITILTDEETPVRRLDKGKGRAVEQEEVEEDYMEVEDEGEVMIETLDVEEDHEEETDEADELPEEDYTGKCLGMFFSE